jgi:flagellar hook-associated protein 2
MVGPISVNGPASGIDTSAIISKIISIQTAPEQIYQSEISSAQAQQNELLKVNVGLLAVKSATDQLRLPSLFASSALSSSNPGALTATSTGTVAPGQYTFQVAQLAQASQLISNGFQDPSQTPVASTPGSISIEVGGGYLDRTTPVTFLNGQTGFDRGSIRIRDSSGASAIVDLGGAATVEDVVSAINQNPSISVRASLQGNRIVLQDLAGGGGTLSVTDAGGTRTAESLGIAGTGQPVAGGQVLVGSDINTVSSSTPLSLLNGGLGVRTNQNGSPDFTITEGSGAGAVTFGVTLAPADTTLGQVIARINSSAAGAGSSVVASLASEGNALVLTSSSGGGLTLAPANGSFAAVDLGLGTLSGATFVQNAVEDASTGQPDTAGNRIVGNSLTPALDSVQRSVLNGGQTSFDASDAKGISDGSVSLTDRLGHTATVNVSTNVAATVSAAAAAGAQSLVLGSVDGFAVGNQVRVQTSVGIEYRTVTALDAATGTVSLDHALQGSVSAGSAAVGINQTLSDILRTVNQGAADQNVGIQIGLNASQDGLTVTDQTQGTASNLIVAGQAASDLGIAGSVAAPSIAGTSLHPQYLGASTRLGSLNGGQGIAAGEFEVTDTNGHHFTVNLNQPQTTTVGSLIQEITGLAAAVGSGVTARVNDTGNGILLVDGTPGSGSLQVQDLAGGQTASELNLAGTAPLSAPDRIDGSFQHVISIAAGSSLQTVANTINAQNLGVTANILNDGSSAGAYHLTLTSQNSGLAGRLTVDTTIPGLSFSTSAAAQNAVLVYGGGGGATPTVVQSQTNTIQGVVPGMTLQLNGVSSSPVTISATHDTKSIDTQIQNFVNSYNSILGTIHTDTSFDPSTNTSGILFGNSALQGITTRLADLVIAAVGGIPAGKLNTLASVGITVGSQGTLSLDQSVLDNALQNNFDQVATLFTQARTMELSTPLSAINSGAGLTDTPGPDFSVTAQDGTTFNVDVQGLKTIGDLLLAINDAPGNAGRVTGQITPDGFSLELVDHTGASTAPLSVQNIGGADAASELQIAQTAPAGSNTIRGGIVTLSGSPGMGAQLSDALNFITEPGDGILAVQSNNLTHRIDDLNQTISSINAIAAQMQVSLVEQFAALEAIIASSQTTSQELAAILGTTTTTTNSPTSLQSILGSNTAGTSSGGTTSGSTPASGSGSTTGATGSSGTGGSGG